MKLIIPVTALLLLVACRRDINNIDPKNPETVPSYALFTNAQRTLASTVSSSNVNLNIFRLIVQQWQQTTYTEESNYNLNTRNIPQQVWQTLYRDVLSDLEQAKTLIPTTVVDPLVQRNQLAITDIMQVYSWYYLVTTFGDIPYSEALNVERTAPKYDNQQTIYLDLLRRLTADRDALNTAAESFGDADIIYSGDITQWKRFANSLLVKLGMTIADSNPDVARTTTESAVQSGVFTSNADNALFRFLVNPPNTNPVWVDLVQSARKDYVAASTFINRLVALNDPRIPVYFTRNAAGGYSGGDPGASSNYATFSKPGTRVTAPDFPGYLLSYSEVEFYLAEAVQRGFAVSGSASQHYNNAVTASITEWGLTEAQAATYLSQPSVAYDPVNWRQRIGEQKWIALYNRGWDAWIEQRRLDYPQLTAPSTATSAYPLRFTYPVSEQNLNRAQYEQAAASIGGDVVTTRLFWDKF